MRDIKFRAWDTNKNMMFYQTNPFNKNKEVDFISESGAVGVRTDSAIEDDHFILMQYTGLKDKNGVEIYEGDIVFIRYDDNPDDVAEFYMRVVWHDGSWYSIEGEHTEEKYYDEPLCQNYTKDMEIRGNIYENVELLKIKKYHDSKNK